MSVKNCLAVFLLTLLAILWAAEDFAEGSYIPNKKMMVVGVLKDSPPLAFSNKNEKVRELRGLTVDLALMLNHSMGLKTQFRPGTAKELAAWLQQGHVDFICGLPQNLGKSFSTQQSVVTGFALNRRIMVIDPNIHITCEQDYPGHRIALLKSDDEYSLTATSFGALVEMVDDHKAGFLALNEGQVDAFVVPCGEIASYMAQRERLMNIKLMGLSLERLPLLLIAPENNLELRAHLAGVLQSFENRGALEVLREKWLGKPVLSPVTFWDKYSTVILYCVAGLLVGLLLILAWNITLRKRVQHVTRHLQYSQRRYHELIEASPDLIMTVDKNGNLRLANRICRETLLCVNESYENYSLMQALCETSRSNMQEILNSVLSGGMAARREVIIHPDSNSPKTLEVIAFKTNDVDSGEPMACCIARDITERQHMENQLLQVERLAVIGKLAAGVAHEINNPLGIILTNAEMALEMNDNAELEKRLSSILRNVGRAASITQRLLHLAVPDRMKVTPLYLEQLVHESLSFLAPRLQNVRVNLDGLAHGLEIHGDQALLQQLIINLLLNALDSMKDEGELQISAFMRPGEGDERGVILTVRDSGKGIAKENLERIFDLFYTTRSRQGFGLGLFISRQIAEQHNGTLYAESENSEGATFILELPVRRVLPKVS